MVKERVFVDLQRRADEDLAVVGLAQTFLVHQDLLVELLAGAQSGELDLDIPVRDEAGQLDEVLGEVKDLDRVAHVEHEDIAAVAHGCRLDDKAHSLRDRHEIAHNVRVRHRDGTARQNLILEQRNDRTVRTEDIAEAHRHKFRLGFLAERLHDHLAQTLRRTHDVRRVDSLVR